MNQLAYLLETAGIAGWIDTPLHDVHRKARQLADGRPDASHGLGHLLPARAEEVLEALGDLSGSPVPPEKSDQAGFWVDPQRTVDQVHAAAKRLRQAVDEGRRVFFGTGHPSGPLELYVRLAAELERRGIDVMRFGEGEAFSIGGVEGRFTVRFVAGVACLYRGGSLLHTHHFEPMEYLMSVGPRPDLVIGDHGFAGVALARGIETIAIVDANDPGLLLACARRLPIHPILCDDNRPPGAYAPVLDAFLAALS